MEQRTKGMPTSVLAAAGRALGFPRTLHGSILPSSGSAASRASRQTARACAAPRLKEPALTRPCAEQPASDEVRKDAGLLACAPAKASGPV
ncbi:MAG: hypothetical protein D6815_06260 [Candidatus Dadabacteria bacterium]|nr:MAG: hypothetical protein D6815_06260 [Candidatus Dadabacteria bacterium]